MNREQALNYLHCSGMSEEQINSVVEGLTSPDAVSREAVLDALHVSGRPTKLFDYVLDVLHDINTLPPVTPKPRTGKWIDAGHYFEKSWATCSECKECASQHTENDEWGFSIRFLKYCPNCGAKMEIGGEDDKS